MLREEGLDLNELLRLGWPGRTEALGGLAGLGERTGAVAEEDEGPGEAESDRVFAGLYTLVCGVDDERVLEERPGLGRLVLRERDVTETCDGADERGRSPGDRPRGPRRGRHRALPLELGDRLLLCSDGLHGYLTDDDLLGLFELDLEDAAPAAVRYANMHGGNDNVTALFVDIVAGA